MLQIKDYRINRICYASKSNISYIFSEYKSYYQTANPFFFSCQLPAGSNKAAALSGALSEDEQQIRFEKIFAKRRRFREAGSFCCEVQT